jgi:hypothetical protein
VACYGHLKHSWRRDDLQHRAFCNNEGICLLRAILGRKDSPFTEISGLIKKSASGFNDLSNASSLTTAALTGVHSPLSTFTKALPSRIAFANGVEVTNTANTDLDITHNLICRVFYHPTTRHSLQMKFLVQSSRRRISGDSSFVS